MAAKVRQCRLLKRWSQEEMASRTGIKLPTYRLFEQSGKISLDRLCKIAITLGRDQDLVNLFDPPPMTSIDEIEARSRIPKRIRKPRR
ncbi:MAG: helix-turn-helix transcriptional regulator [Verrucomicrobiae bacterium]|nr:helix-turn-helix transcriptional regulator [Verrucomicrobiae bacterium]